jgi:hypothetical protein
MNCKNGLQARRQRTKKLENKKKEGTEKLITIKKIIIKGS